MHKDGKREIGSIKKPLILASVVDTEDYSLCCTMSFLIPIRSVLEMVSHDAWIIFTSLLCKVIKN